MNTDGLKNVFLLFFIASTKTTISLKQMRPRTGDVFKGYCSCNEVRHVQSHLRSLCESSTYSRTNLSNESKLTFFQIGDLLMHDVAEMQCQERVCANRY